LCCGGHCSGRSLVCACFLGRTFFYGAVTGWAFIQTAPWWYNWVSPRGGYELVAAWYNCFLFLKSTMFDCLRVVWFIFTEPPRSRWGNVDPMIFVEWSRHPAPHPLTNSEKWGCDESNHYIPQTKQKGDEWEDKGPLFPNQISSRFGLLILCFQLWKCNSIIGFIWHMDGKFCSSVQIWEEASARRMPPSSSGALMQRVLWL
jgi:hypothetical protein